MNIAVFGGSFDPLHVGHVKAVELINKKLDVERIFIVPAFINPFKCNYKTPPKTRLMWCKRVFTSFKNVTVLDYEIRQNKPTSTIKTIKFIKFCYKPIKIYLIIGADNLQDLHAWEKYEELKEMVEIVVLTREGSHIPKNLKKIDINVNISSSNLRKNLEEKYIPIQIRNLVKNSYQGK